MVKDFTFSEIDRVKIDIKLFDDQIKKIANNNKEILTENDISFYNFLAKRIIFFKYFLFGMNDARKEHLCKVIISDLYNLILSLLDSEYRYAYLNERSLIENYCRLILFDSNGDSYINSDLFDKLKQQDYKFNFNQDEYSLLISEYKTCCEFVHGGGIIGNSLKFIIEEYEDYTWDFKEKNAYYERIKKIFKFLDKLLISNFTEYVDSCFFRKKTLLEFLLKKDILEIIFYCDE